MPCLVGKEISQNGVGLANMTRFGSPLSDEEAFPVLRAAVAAGANVWAGADFYGTPDNNSLHLLNRYFTAYPEDAEKVIICLKSGILDMRTHSFDCSREGMRKSVDNALRILDGKKKIDIFGPARVDPNVPIEETVKALAQLVDEGKIGGILLSEMTAPTIQRAMKVAKIDLMESEISLWATDVFDNGVAELCGANGIPMLAHTPLGGGMLTGRFKSIDDLPAKSHHRFFPRFQPDNFQKNLDLVEAVKKIAESKNCSMAQLALNWIKAQSQRPGMPFLIPVSGSSSAQRMTENTKEIKLAKEDLSEVQEILDTFPVVGERYPAAGMKLIQ